MNNVNVLLVNKNRQINGGFCLCVLFFYFFIFFTFPKNVNVYWTADQMDATNANHRNKIPAWDNIFIVTSNFAEMVSGVIIVLTANNIKNENIVNICNVVLILPSEKRFFGTGISNFWVPKNSRRPLMYNSRAIIKIIGIITNQKRIIIANMINVFTTNNLSPM